MSWPYALDTYTFVLEIHKTIWYWFLWLYFVQFHFIKLINSALKWCFQKTLISFGYKMPGPAPTSYEHNNVTFELQNYVEPFRLPISVFSLRSAQWTTSIYCLISRLMKITTVIPGHYHSEERRKYLGRLNWEYPGCTWRRLHTTTNNLSLSQHWKPQAL